MNKLIKAKINLSAIDRDRLFQGEKGLYLDINIWMNDTIDQYGNCCSIQQQTKKDEKKIYVGNGKWFESKEEDHSPPTASTEWMGGKKTNADKVEQDIRDGKFEENAPF